MRKTFLFLFLLAVTTVSAQKATAILNASKPHQHITGFGGFVCSPQFTYNHMSETEIKKVWGASSTVGCNIMRLYIPIGKNAWSQSLQTAKLAKKMGLIVFASPWGQPVEWKTNGTINAKNSDGTTGKLKAANWKDYAQYLEDYVQYMRKNGVELDAISIQNEPDWPATYAGCLWSADEIAKFVKTYGRTISCKIMAPETLAVNDSYVNALNKSDVLDCFDIYGGHQYGGIQSAYKNLAKKGKEIWMTEYLINWNEAEGNERNFDFSKDFFNFFRAINTCMLGDFNAWIHYAAKRYYAMMGDGQRGAGSSGVITKRGYVMAHFARFVTGMTRIDATFSGGLEGSAYLSQTGDTVVAVIANAGDQAVELTLDLPFYTTQGKLYTTVKSKNFSSATLAPQSETCRPQATVAAKSVCTVLFFRSRDRQPSNMKGTMAFFDRIDDQTPTSTTFGTTYKLSGKTKKFDHNTALISTRTDASSGYLALNDRFCQLVMHVKKVTSTMNLSSAKTTLTYINGAGELSSHDYGDIDMGSGSEFDLVFDLSPATLADGCQGLLSLTNNNWSSTLSITFGDVYFTRTAGQSAFAATLSGAYVADDSYVLDYSGNPACTSFNLTKVTGLPAELDWLTGNRVAYLPEGAEAPTANNTVVGSLCPRLVLTDDGGDFRPATPFSAGEASLTCHVSGARLVMLPFKAAVPATARVSLLDIAGQQVGVVSATSVTDSIAAHQPVWVVADGDVTFTGRGDVAYAASPLTDWLRGTYTATTLAAGDYIAAQLDGQWGLQRVSDTATLLPFYAYAVLDSDLPFLPISADASEVVSIDSHWQTAPTMRFDLQGRRLTGSTAAKGLVIVRSADGTIRKHVKH